MQVNRFVLIEINFLMNNTEKGKIGEELACNYLNKNGYTLIERNFRFKRAEIDIIAQKDDTLIFIEVKFRKNNAFGTPEIAVNSKKEQLILEAAANYTELHNWNKDIRFDIIAITENIKNEIYHIQDAFH